MRRHTPRGEQREADPHKRFGPREQHTCNDIAARMRLEREQAAASSVPAPVATKGQP